MVGEGDKPKFDASQRATLNTVDAVVQEKLLRGKATRFIKEQYKIDSVSPNQTQMDKLLDAIEGALNARDPEVAGAEIDRLRKDKMLPPATASGDPLRQWLLDALKADIAAIVQVEIAVGPMRPLEKDRGNPIGADVPPDPPGGEKSELEAKYEEIKKAWTEMRSKLNGVVLLAFSPEFFGKAETLKMLAYAKSGDEAYATLTSFGLSKSEIETISRAAISVDTPYFGDDATKDIKENTVSDPKRLGEYRKLEIALASLRLKIAHASRQEPKQQKEFVPPPAPEEADAASVAAAALELLRSRANPAGAGNRPPLRESDENRLRDLAAGSEEIVSDSEIVGRLQQIQSEMQAELFRILPILRTKDLNVRDAAIGEDILAAAEALKLGPKQPVQYRELREALSRFDEYNHYIANNLSDLPPGIRHRQDFRDYFLHATRLIDQLKAIKPDNTRGAAETGTAEVETEAEANLRRIRAHAAGPPRPSGAGRATQEAAFDEFFNGLAARPERSRQEEAAAAASSPGEATVPPGAETTRPDANSNLDEAGRKEPLADRILTGPGGKLILRGVRSARRGLKDRGGKVLRGVGPSFKKVIETAGKPAAAGIDATIRALDARETRKEESRAQKEERNSEFESGRTERAKEIGEQMERAQPWIARALKEAKPRWTQANIDRYFTALGASKLVHDAWLSREGLTRDWRENTYVLRRDEDEIISRGDAVLRKYRRLEEQERDLLPEERQQLEELVTRGAIDVEMRKTYLNMRGREDMPYPITKKEWKIFRLMWRIPDYIAKVQKPKREKALAERKAKNERPARRKRSEREILPVSPAPRESVEAPRTALTNFEKRFIFSEIRANKHGGVTLAHAETFFRMWDRNDNKGVPAGSDEEKAREQEAADKIYPILNKGK